MKRIVYIGMIMLIIALLGFEGMVIRKQSALLGKTQSDLSMAEHHIAVLKGNMADSWHLERTKFNVDGIVDEDGRKPDANHFRFDCPVMLFRFSKVDCSDCVVEQIDLIQEFIRNTEIRHMMICDYSSKRNLGIFKRVNAIKDTVYDCEKMLEGEHRTPYFCMYGGGVISDVFFPDDDFPELTKMYFKEITAKYFKEP